MRSRDDQGQLSAELPAPQGRHRMKNTGITRMSRAAILGIAALAMTAGLARADGELNV